MILDKVNPYCKGKSWNISSDDKPWFACRTINQIKKEESKVVESSIPQWKPYVIRKYLPGDIPARIIIEFALFICVPMADIINNGVKRGQWPKFYKRETITQTVLRQKQKKSCAQFQICSI